MKILSTNELKIYIDGLFDKLRPFANEVEKYIVYDIFNIQFTAEIDKLWPGMFCYSDDYHYYYCDVGDRGKVTSEKFDNLIDLTYAVFRFQTHGLAFAYAHKNSDKFKDIRRIAFPRQVELMRLIGEEYAQKLEKQIAEILKESPYNDELYIQA